MGCAFFTVSELFDLSIPITLTIIRLFLALKAYEYLISANLIEFYTSNWKLIICKIFQLFRFWLKAKKYVQKLTFGHRIVGNLYCKNSIISWAIFHITAVMRWLVLFWIWCLSIYLVISYFSSPACHNVIYKSFLMYFWSEQSNRQSLFCDCHTF